MHTPASKRTRGGKVNADGDRRVERAARDPARTVAAGHDDEADREAEVPDPADWPRNRAAKTAGHKYCPKRNGSRSSTSEHSNSAFRNRKLKQWLLPEYN